jgi:hypothetical protein
VTGARIAALAAALGMASGCASKSEDASTNRVAELCQQTSNLDAKICACVGQKAGELSPVARSLVVATFEKRADRIEEIRKQLSLPDAATAAMFVTTAPARCAREQSAPRG